MRAQRRLDTLEAVALTESALHPYALSLNYPATVAAYNGLHNQEVYLTRQPATLPEAIHWTRWFHSRGYTVSIGLMQINSENAARYGVTFASFLTHVQTWRSEHGCLGRSIRQPLIPGSRTLMPCFPHFPFTTQAHLQLD